MLSHHKTSAAVALLAVGVTLPAQAFRSTDLQSFTDPDYRGFRPKRVLLTVVSDGSGTRRMVEEHMRDALEKRGITVFGEYDLFVPTRQWSPLARDAVFAERRIDARLITTAAKVLRA